MVPQSLCASLELGTRHSPISARWAVFLRATVALMRERVSKRETERGREREEERGREGEREHILYSLSYE